MYQGERSLSPQLSIMLLPVEVYPAYVIFIFFFLNDKIHEFLWGYRKTKESILDLGSNKRFVSYEE
jgi:1-acyl-sn-glycerol-3-phosphate acyltransferase